MKRKTLLVLAILMIMVGNVLPVFAESNGFVKSIEVPEDVVIVDEPEIIVTPEKDEPIVEPTEETFEIEVHSYQFIDEIESEESRNALIEAYEQISALDDISLLAPDEITEIAHEKGALTEDLVVRDLFDVTAYDEITGEAKNELPEGQSYSFTLGSENLDNFICLLVYHNNEWHVVKDVEVLADQNLLNVITNELSPFAIVVATAYRYKANAIGCIWHLFIIITLLISFVVVQLFRRNNNDSQMIKRNIIIRDVICIVNLVLCLIFYILGTCKYDIYALIADIIIVIIATTYTHPNKKEK